jgi:hypothetical protein
MCHSKYQKAQRVETRVVPELLYINSIFAQLITQDGLIAQQYTMMFLITLKFLIPYY